MNDRIKCGVCGHDVSVFKAANGMDIYLCICLGFGCGRVSMGGSEKEAILKWEADDVSFTLKKCPFCGGDPLAQVGDEKPNITQTKEHRIWCRDCGATVRDYTSFGLAVEKWERRIQ